MADNRILEFDPAQASPAQQKVLERVTQGRGRILTPYKIWIQCPEIADGMEIIGTYLNTAASLSFPEVELAIVVIAAHWGSPFVINAHVKHGIRAGLDKSALEKIVAKQNVSFADERLQTIYDMVSVSLRGGAASDDEFARFERVLGRRGIAEVLILVGYYTSVAIGMRMHNVEPAAD